MSRCLLGLLVTWLLIAPAAQGQPETPARRNGTVTALGRLEPRDGVIHVSAPSGRSAVVRELLVREGDWVEQGQTLAVLDRHALNQAHVDRLEAELENAERERARVRSLVERRAESQSELDDADVGVRIARANLAAAKAELELSRVTAPSAGQVLEVHTRAGERPEGGGIIEIGATDQMYAVAEVYETEIGRVKPGQRVLVTSPALSSTVEGTVELIAAKVGKLDLIDADPIAKTDARVVEVRIKLADSDEAARLTNLQVDVEIFP